MGFGSYLNRNAPTCPSFEAESASLPQPPGQECTVVAGGAVIQSCPNCLRRSRRRLRGQTTLVLSSSIRFLLTHPAVEREDLVRQRRRGALRLSECERRARNVFDLSVHWVISDCRVNTADYYNVIPGSNNTLEFSNPIVGHWARISTGLR